MPRFANLRSNMTHDETRPNGEGQSPWLPKKSSLLILAFLYEYRFLTSELLAMLYEHTVGRGRYHVQHELTKLYRHGFIDRAFRRTEVGSSQYVYFLRPDGARLLLPAKEWDEEKARIYKIGRERRDYEHALVVSLVHALWKMGSPSQNMLFLTEAIWQDKEITKEGIQNEFVARLGKKDVKVHPDLTVLIGHRQKGYYRPYFFEVERTHKNYTRLRWKMAAYAALFSRSGNNGVQGVFARQLGYPGFKPAPGMAVFVGADEAHMKILRAQANEAIRRDTEIWFTSLERLVELKELEKMDGTVRQHRGRPLIVETPILPAEFFSRQLLVNMDGKPGCLVI